MSVLEAWLSPNIPVGTAVVFVGLTPLPVLGGPSACSRAAESLCSTLVAQVSITVPSVKELVSLAAFPPAVTRFPRMLALPHRQRAAPGRCDEPVL